jgi:hypothetical protein
MWCAVSRCIGAIMVLFLATADAAAGQRLAYVVSYEGLFSAGVPMEIAGAQLELGSAAAGSSAQAVLQVSTAGYGAAELLYPVRYCYRSRLDRPAGATRHTEWWGRTGSELSRGSLSFDAERGRVLRLEVKSNLDGDGADPTGSVSPAAPPPKLEREEVALPAEALPMDRLAMLWWLRRQPLEPGSLLQPVVSNGSRLHGYRIEVEGVEEISWQGEVRPCYRLRLEPLVDDDSEAHPVRLWLSRDRERLPLLLRSSRGFGSFEARLSPDHEADLPGCGAPESTGLALPQS